MRVENKNCIVTGGASGIGLAAVKALLHEGARVVIADLVQSDGESAAQKLAKDYPDRCRFEPMDVTNTTDVDAAFARTKDAWGSVDIVFNNAGVGGMQPADTYPDEDFLRVIDINLNGVFRVARAALRIMYTQGSGSIINCASILGMMGQSQTAAYTAAKGGVVNLTRTLAIEAAAHGVRVNGIGPGYIDTPLLNEIDEETRQALISLHPLQRLGKPEEVAAAVVFLGSEEASFITGTTLMVDGGFTAGKS
ncbi:SDR family NAD(P)-dependent oxidoreductase [Aliidiomarina sp. Khilg15.8]